MMHLFGYWRSSAAYRCRIALALKGLNYDFTSVHLRRGGGEQRLPDFLTLNPQGLVPALVEESKVLTQSLAIIEWLDETHPTPALLPVEPDARAQVRAFALAIACDIHPLQNLRVLEYLKTELGCEQADADAWCRKWISEGLLACEALLSRDSGGHRFCFGESPSLADICLAPQIYSARRFGVDLTMMGRIRDLEQVYEAEPAFASAHPDVQPDKDA